MKKVDYEHFARFLMPHSIQAKGKDLYFSVKEAKVEENKYIHNLYRIRKGKVAKMTSLGDLGKFELTDQGIIFPACRTEEEKKKSESGEPVTFFYKLPYDGGEAVPFLTVPYTVEKLFFTDKNRFFTVVSENLLYLDYVKKNKGNRAKAAEQMKKEESDYHVVDQIPFYSNGGGYTNGIVTNLYLYEKGKYTPVLNNPNEQYSIYSAVNGKICYTTSDFSSKRSDLYNKLFVLDMATLEKTEITFNSKCSHELAYALEDGRILALINMTDKHGLNQNSDLCVYENGKWNTIYSDGNMCFYNSVGSDVKAGGRTCGSDVPVKANWFYFINTDYNRSVLTRINLDNGRIEKLTDNQMNISSFDFVQDKIAIIGMEGNSGSEVWSVDNGTLKQITKFNTKLCSEYEYSKPEELTFKDKNGVEIYGWVMKPSNYNSSEKYPAILDIHGGPKTVYGSCYFHEMQMWASMGYFVFFCNPVGGDGRGNEFLDIFGHYGDQDYKDIMQFTDVVLEQYPAIDKSRVGVTGGSYGGFMTNWIIGHTDRFKAAASQRSISNWISFHNTSDIGYYFSPDQNLADPWENPEKLWEHSPLKYADNVKTPTLFIHSDEDYRCPLSEGMQMFTALKDHGVDARMCIFKGENHELSRSGKPKHRIRRLMEITQWFDKYLKYQ